jgi:hypothetical protein
MNGVVMQSEGSERRLAREKRPGLVHMVSVVNAPESNDERTLIPALGCFPGLDPSTCLIIPYPNPISVPVLSGKYLAAADEFHGIDAGFHG